MDWEVTELIERYPSEGASDALCMALGRARKAVVHKASEMSLPLNVGVLSSIRVKATKRGKNSTLFRGCEDIPGQFIAHIRKTAKARDIAHPLLDGSIDNNRYLWELYTSQNGRCALTDIPIFFHRRSVSDSRLGCASLDRIDSSGVYEVGNVQWVHKHVNAMKRSLPQAEFILLAHKIARKHPITEGTLD